MADSITRLSDFLRNKGILTQTAKIDGNEFFGYVAEEHYGNISKHYKTRKEICELEKKNAFYFHLFLPVVAQINEANLKEHLENDLKTISRRGRCPSPRDIYAASELLRRKIYICDFSGQQDYSFRSCMMFVYSPIIHLERKDVNPLYLLMLDVNGVKQFSKLQLDFVKKFMELFQESPNFANHEHCIGRRFTNNFFKLRNDAFPSENHETKDFFRTLSLEMYGTYEYRNMVMASIFSLQVEEDYIEIFAKFLENTENLTLQQKKQFILEHQQFVREETESPGQGDIFAAVSVFNIQLFLQNYQCSETDFYIPLSGSYIKEFDSFLSLKEESKKMFRRADTKLRLCLCKQEKPQVNGTLGLLKDDIYCHLKITTPCCPSGTVHGGHHHFRMIEGSKHQTEEITPYTMPINEVLRTLNKLKNEERTLDQIDDGHGSLYKCLAKEIFGNENFENRHLRQMMDIGDFDGNTEERIDNQIRSVCNWLQVPIYVFRNTHYGHHVWKYYEPSAHKGVSECRYYITIYNNISRHCFDRIVPRNGCNCQVPPPLTLTNQNTDSHQTWLLTVSKTERHKPMVEFLSEETIQDDMFETEVREIPQCLPYSEIRLVMKRSDMRNRVIDKMAGQLFSLYRCLSKEIFGCEDRHEFVLKAICSELVDNPELFAKRCKGSEEEEGSKFIDFFKRKSTVTKEKQLAAVRLKSEEIEDGITDNDLELEVAATRFQTEIYILVVRKDGMSEWCLYKPCIIRESMNKSAIRSKCPERKFYVTLYHSSTDEFYRIVPRSEECNCCLRPPEIQSAEPDSHTNLPINERRMVNTARRMENTIGNVGLVLSGWAQCNVKLQQLCDSMVKEIEDRRFKVNIATITGSSVGLVGAGLAVGGLILAPFTLGASTVLTIVGGAVGGVGGVTAMGAKIGESVLNVDSMHKLEKYKKSFQEHSYRLEESIDNLTETVEDFGNAVESIQLDNSLETFDKSVFQSIPGFFRAVKGFSVIPLGILRFAFRGATILGAIIGPLSALLDIGFLAFSAWNLHHGSKTDVSESLRRTSAVLLASRRQMHAWALGNKVEDQLL